VVFDDQDVKKKLIGFKQQFTVGNVDKKSSGPGQANNVTPVDKKMLFASEQTNL